MTLINVADLKEKVEKLEERIGQLFEWRSVRTQRLLKQNERLDRIVAFVDKFNEEKWKGRITKLEENRAKEKKKIKTETNYHHVDWNTFVPVGKDPDSPLKAKVAKAFGSIVKFHEGLWLIQKWNPGDVNENATPHYYDIPDYDIDIKLAIKALEEYCQIKNADVDISILRRSDIIYFCKIGLRGELAMPDRGIVRKSNSLPVAICEAIVSHDESSRR